MHQKTVVVVCGPTAVGKTAFAIELATALQTEIISADSRQCFKELNIGVAKPSQDELATVKHYFINSHSIFDEVNAAVFEEYALSAVNKIFNDHLVAVVVGGTGLYIKAFCEGLDEIPFAEPGIREQIIAEYKLKGLSFLQQEVAQKDPLFWKTAEQQNPHRLIRALEIWLSTGRSIVSFKTGKKVSRPFRIIKVGLESPRQVLYDQINCRVDNMIAMGLIDEVKTLERYQTINALQTVGYKEIFQALDGVVSFDKAVENIKINTRHYAKRQMTWFKKDEQVRWYSARDITADQICQLVYP